MAMYPICTRRSAVGAAAVALVLLVTVASCGTTVLYTPSRRRAAAAEPARSPARVEVYDQGAPTRPAIVIGTLATQPDSIYVDTHLDGALVDEMRRVAARNGCNAIVMDGATPAPDARLGGRAFATVSYHASCLVFTDAKPR